MCPLIRAVTSFFFGSSFQILFLSGLGFVIGLERTLRFFFQREKLKASAFFFGGIFVVLVGWPLVGMALELYGAFVLFSGVFPVVINFLRRLPIIGTLLNLPGISRVGRDSSSAALAREVESPPVEGRENKGNWWWSN